MLHCSTASSTAVLQQGWELRTITDQLLRYYTLFCIALYPPQSCHVVVCLLFPNCIFQMLTGNNLIIECRNSSCVHVMEYYTTSIRDLIWYDQVLQSPKKSKEWPQKSPPKNYLTLSLDWKGVEDGEHYNCDSSAVRVLHCYIVPYPDGVLYTVQSLYTLCHI